MKNLHRAVLVISFLLMGASPAFGHGDVSATVPPKGSTLKKPIDHLAITFSQAPTKDAVIKVIDGCDRNVVKRVDLQDRVAHVYLDDPQPGKWRVDYRIVSSVDGHPSKDGYGLSVGGKADCSEADGGEEGSGGNGSGPNAAGDDGPAPDDDGSSFPVIPVAIGTVVIVGLAFVVRRASQ